MHTCTCTFTCEYMYYLIILLYNQEVLEDFCTVWWYMITNSIWKKVVEIYALYETSIRVRELSYRIFLCEGDKGSPSISLKIRSVL